MGKKTIQVGLVTFPVYGTSKHIAPKNVYNSKFRLCSSKGFYHGRNFIFTAIEGASFQDRIARIIAESLGARFKYVKSGGCLSLQKRLPKPKTTLGLVTKYCI